MGQLISDLLSFSRLSRQQMNLAEINMTNMAQKTWGELRAGCAGRNIEFKIGDLPAARGDSSLLQQVLINLISNAIKFTRPRDVAVIQVEGSINGGDNVYCVKDNGVGFDGRYADKLFGVFHRLHTQEEFEGTGVGLAIVHRIVTRHGGKVWAESKPGEGAAFYFTLPGKGD
jgi:light-regulated signal transduction histidine kinase (bacteriophytochrome)